MRHLSVAKVGLSFGIVVALWHAIWATMVATGVAGPLLDFILRLHSIEVNITVAPFDLVTALTLVSITFVVGFLYGAAFAMIWNWLASARAGAAKGGTGAATA
jgi:hypothetical protein